MAHIVYIASGLRGSLYNTIELCRGLIDAGHDVTVLAFRDIEDDVVAAGVSFEFLADGPNAESEVRQRIDQVGELRAIPISLRMRRRVVSSTEVRDTVERLQPDLLLIDAEMQVALIQTAHLDIPTVTAVPFFSVYPESGVPPAHTTLKPRSDLVGRLRIWCSWKMLWFERFRQRTIGHLAPRALRRRLRPFQLNSPSLPALRAVARAHGLRLRDHVDRRQWLKPHRFTDVPMLSYTSASLDFAQNPPSDFHHIGPLINDDRLERLVDDEDRARWLAFRESVVQSGTPLVYGSMGSMQPANVDYYRHLIAVFALRRDLALVLGLGRQGDRESLGPIPENVLLMKYAPQLDVLRVASVAVHSGGAGTLNECVHHLVPSIVCSTMPVDQPGNVARTEFFQLGIALPIEEMSASTLSAAIDQVLDNDHIARSLARHKVEMDRYTSDRTGVRLIQHLLDQSTD